MPPDHHSPSHAAMDSLPSVPASEASGARWRVQPGQVAAAAIGYLVVAWLAFFVVDVFNVAGSRDLLISRLANHPSLWVQLFREGRLTEWLQWLSLGTAALLAAGHAGRLWERADRHAQRLAMFWSLIGAALVLMLIEDAGNPRHRIRQYTYHFIDTAIAGRAVEFAFMALLAALPLYALIRYWPVIRQHASVMRYLLAAFALYAVAGVSSATRHWYEWHERVGEAALALLLRIDDGFVIYEDLGRQGYWLMDMIVEESVELIAAVMFLCAALAFIEVLRRGDGGGRITTQPGSRG